MFSFFRKRKISQQICGAQAYADECLKAAQEEASYGHISYSLAVEEPSNTVGDLMRQFAESKDTVKLLRQLDQAEEATFVDCLTAWISKKKLRDSQVYKAALMDRRLFSKMMSDRHYQPSKNTVISLAVALKLPLREASDLLSRAGYVLSHSSKRDLIIEYFIREQSGDLSALNEILYQLGQKTVSRA